MASTPSKAIDQATRHAIHVERLKSHDVNVLREMLQDIEDTLIARIARSKPESWTRGEMERRLAAYREMIGQKYADDIIPELNRQIGELALNEARFEIKNLDSVVQNYQFSLPTENQIMTAIRANPLNLGGRFEGSLLGGLIDDFEANQIRVMTNTIRAGYAGGETTQQIISRLQQEAFPIAKRDLESVVRTSLQHAAGQAMQATYQANSDIIKGYRIVATLDGRTSFECRARDGEVLPLDSTDLPPWHHRCRTVFTAVLDDRFSFLEDGATRAARDPETGKIVREPAKKTYYQWLKEQDRPFVESVIGAKRAKLLLDGNISAQRFAEMQLGKRFEPLTLAKMRELDPLVFERAEVNP
jgi:SPP1 gp7 family putative phage head morphogenesis protein